ncbi:phage protein Gp36 family protein [Flavobacterium sp.]|uniref:phage protein Gp36 family protein n=1 Tax=Flavobacterium sp. TaxID=239 RepID=UPI003265CCEC
MALSFLTIDDLITQLFETYLDDSVQEDLDALDNIEAQQIAFIKSKLRSRFDTAVMFSAAEYEDKPVIRQVLTSLVNYYVVKRNAPRKIPTDFKDNYNWAIKWLNDVRDGVEGPELPLKEVVRKQVLWGNNKNEDHYY